MSISFYDIVVVGAGIAGLSAIKQIRKKNTDLSVLLLNNEDRLPYKRTKINKNIAQGFSKNQFSLLEQSWYNENKVDIIYDELTNIISKQNFIELKSGKRFEYAKLLLATGSTPNMPVVEGINANEIFYVHFATRVEQLMKFVHKKHSFLIIGGGVEGVETADQLAKMGKEVTVVERNQNPLSKLFPNEITNYYYKQIAASSINYFAKVALTSLEKTTTGRYLWKFNGKQYLFDGVIACAGTKPNITLAKNAGIHVKKGIVVNDFLQTSIENIFAAGDVAEHPGGLVTGLWHPAEYQGFSAGENMLNLGKSYLPVPMRLKTEVFNNFYFSANYFNYNTEGIQLVTQKSSNTYVQFYILNSRIVGIAMMNDKENAKLYHKAVAEGLKLDEFNCLLGKA